MDAGQNPAGYDAAVSLRDGGASAKESAAVVSSSMFGLSSQADTILCMAVAEIAKHEELRDPLAQKGIAKALVGVIQRSLVAGGADCTEGLTHAFRAIGNLCFDHDENRALVLESDGVVAIRNGIAALLEDPASQVRPDTALSHAAAAGVVLNLATGNDTAFEACTNTDLPGLIAQLYVEAKTEIENAMAVRTAVLFWKDTKLLDTLAQHGGVERLISALEEEVSDPDADGSGCEDCITLIRQICQEDHRLTAFRPAKIDQKLQALVTCTCLPVASIAATAYAVALADDVCLNTALSKRGLSVELKRATEWMRRPHERPEDWDIPSAGAIAVGNMARTAERSIEVLDDHDVLDALFAMVTSDKSGLQYAALGAIKNLAIPQANKEVLVGRGVMECVNIVLESPQGALQYLGVSLVRSLCMSKQAVPGVVSLGGPSLIPALLRLSASEEQAVRSESTRALGNLCRNAVDDVVIGQLSRGIPTIVTQLSSEHKILISEALLALVSLCGRGIPDVTAALEAAETRNATLQCLVQCSEQTLACNALTLIGALGVPTSKAELDEVDSALSSAAQMGPLVSEQCVKVRSVLGL